MPLVNIDTDMIIPKQFLKTIARTGLGVNLFDKKRYSPHRQDIRNSVSNLPEPCQSSVKAQESKTFAGKGFGCDHQEFINRTR